MKDLKEQLREALGKMTEGTWFPAYFDDSSSMSAVGIAKTDEMLENTTNIKDEWERFGNEERRRLIAITGMQSDAPVGDYPADPDAGGERFYPTGYGNADAICTIRNLLPAFLGEYERLEREAEAGKALAKKIEDMDTSGPCTPDCTGCSALSAYRSSCEGEEK